MENVQELLKSTGIDIIHILPAEPHANIEDISSLQKKHLFPLELFDDSELDTKTSPLEWLQSGYAFGEAFLPRAGDCGYSWMKVTVDSYDPTSNKWTVTKLVTSEIFEVPRIYLLFNKEDPQEFVKRVQCAVKLRDEHEIAVKFDMIVDCLQLDEQPGMPEKLSNKVIQSSTNSFGEYDKEMFDALQEQITQEYRRIQAALEFRSHIEKHPTDFPLIQLPDKPVFRANQPIFTIGRNRFKELQTWLRTSGIFPETTEIHKPKVSQSESFFKDHIGSDVDLRQEMIHLPAAKPLPSIQEILTVSGVQISHMLPVDTSFAVGRNPYALRHLFPLEMFDNVESDRRTPSDWLQSGYAFGEALLPRVENCAYSWMKVTVDSYDDTARKWTVTNRATSEQFEIPRIYVFFSDEDPAKFVKRVKSAVQLREEYERALKFEMTLDCLKLDGQPEIPQKVFNKMLKFAMSTNKDYDKDYFNILQKELNREYQRTEAAIEFRKHVLGNPSDFPLIEFPDKPAYMPKQRITTIGKKRFVELKALLKKNTIFYAPEPILAMHTLVSQCEALQTRSLFTLTAGRITYFKEFASTQEHASTTITKYLKQFWIDDITHQLTMRLRLIGKGWLDLSTKRWDVYKVSKMFRLLRQIKYRMENTLHDFLERSILTYVKHLCDPCDTLVKYFDDISCEKFQWNFPLKGDFFQSVAPPLFSVTISMDTSGAYYSVELESFREDIVRILDDALDKSCGIHQIDPKVMSSLVFRNDLYLKSGALVEDLYECSREKLQKTYDCAIVALKVYARRFHEYLPLYATEVADWIKDFFQVDRTPDEVRVEITNQILLQGQLSTNLPQTIIIGPFLISVEALKQQLLKKRKGLIRKNLEYYTSFLTQYSESLGGKFEFIMRTISEKPTSIEHIYTIRKFAETVPATIEQLTPEMRQIVHGFEVLDHFRHSLSDESFRLKWQLIAWPHKILKFLDGLAEKQAPEIDDFKRQQIGDVAALADRIDSMNAEILKYSLWSDPLKAAENAVEIKKTSNSIKELNLIGDTLEKRQTLLGLPPMRFTELEEITTNFNRYKSLWYSCADFLKYEEFAYGNNLVNLDMPHLMEIFGRIRESLIQSAIDFEDHAEIANVAEYYLNLMDKFQPALDILKCIKSEHWTILHWQELIRRAELSMKYAPSINFRYCVSKGILEHVDLVKEIWTSAKAGEGGGQLEEDEASVKDENEAAAIQKQFLRRARTDI